jgi:hypothetical protein
MPQTAIDALISVLLRNDLREILTAGGLDSRKKAQEAQKQRPTQTGGFFENSPSGFFLRLLRLFAANPFVLSVFAERKAYRCGGAKRNRTRSSG